MIPRRHTSHASQRGFSLLELLIALIIAGIALVTMFRAATESIHATAVAARYQEAISRARSHLDGISADLAVGEHEGDDGGGFRWRVLVRAVDSTGGQDVTGRPIPGADMPVLTLFATTVWVSWREGMDDRAVRLDSRRLFTVAPS